MKYLVILCMTICMACSGEEEDKFCINFDRRQCMGDPWSVAVDINADATVQANQLKAFLESEGITVHEIRADLQFHDIVCEACIVCPDGARFFLSIDQNDERKILDWDPLNYSRIDCSNL